MCFLAQTLDNADPLFALVETPGFYLHRVEVTDQDPASGSLFKQMGKYLLIHKISISTSVTTIPTIQKGLVFSRQCIRKWYDIHSLFRLMWLFSSSGNLQDVCLSIEKLEVQILSKQTCNLEVV